MRLLYVEDEPALLQVTAKRLKAEGYGVDTCANGTEALDYIALTDYDAVILDIMLPGHPAGNARPGQPHACSFAYGTRYGS